MSNPDETFNFPNRDGQPADTFVVSDCVRLVNLPAPLTLTRYEYSQGEVSVNGGAFTADAVTVRSNDTLRMRLRTPEAADDTRETILQLPNGDFIGRFATRAANDDRGPQVFQVGPTRQYKQLTEVAGLLRAGDVVELDGGATYSAVRFNRAGLPEAPIWIRGVLVNGQRPVISGGSFTIDLRDSHHYILDNLEITAGTEVCVRSQANGVRVMRSYIHDCRYHGVLGSDMYSGTVVIDRTEIVRAGGQPPGANLKHPVYVATDRDSYPGSKLKVIHSYIHEFGGNGIKSRSERAEVYFNWIESQEREDSYYSVQLIGFQEYLPQPAGLDGDVVGNVLVHRSGYGVSLGGDGTGASRGHVRMVNNTLIYNDDRNEWGPAAMSVVGPINSIWATNNAFYVLGTNEGLRLWRASDADWETGAAKCTGTNNWASSSPETGADYTPPALERVSGDTNPGCATVASFDTLDVAITAGSALAGAGTSSVMPPAGYEIDNPLTTLGAVAPHVRPVSGSELIPTRREPSATMNVGAH